MLIKCEMIPPIEMGKVKYKFQGTDLQEKDILKLALHPSLH